MRKLLSLMVVMAVFASTPLTGGAAPHPLATLCPSLQAEAEAFSAKVGFVVLDLNDDTICAANDGDTFRTASLYKLLILVEAYEQIATGDFSLDETITIEARHWADDPLSMRQEQPIEFEAREALRRMIIHSENSSALALYERLTPAALAAAPSRLGLDGTSLDGPFITTPSDIAALYAGLYRGDIVSGDASNEMLAVLRDQQINDLIPLLLPEGIAVAHKTGIIEQSLHDAGIVFAPGGDFVLVLMTEWERDIDDSYFAIHQMASLTYDAFAVPFEVTPPVSAPPAPVEVAPVVAEPAPVAVQTGAAAPAVESQPAAVIPAAPAVPVVAPAPGIAWWEQTAVRIGAVAALGLAIVALMLSSGAAGSGNPLSSIVARFPYARVDRRQVMATGESTSMPFGSRSRPDEESAPAEPQPEIPLELDSQRLQRLVQYFSAQTELLNEMRTQVEAEITPLVDLIGHQRQTVDQLLENLEHQLRPLNDYAATEESNLNSLEQRLGGEQSEFVLSQFQTYLGQQRQRIEETRQRIDDQRDPLVAYADHQQDTVEVALSRFDADVDALEQNLSEQRKVMMRMLDAMRSESFTVVRGFLADRESELSDAAASGETHPGKLGEQLSNLSGAIRGSSDQHISEVVAASDRADETLKSAAPDGPRPIVRPPAEDAATADEEARTSA